MSDMQNRQTEPQVKEGYAATFYPVRWKPYKPNSQQFRQGIKGRWQRMAEYGGWENCEAPNAVHAEPFDADQAAAEIERLRAERDALREALRPFAERMPCRDFAEHQLLLLSEDNPKGRRLCHFFPEHFSEARALLSKGDSHD